MLSKNMASSSNRHRSSPLPSRRNPAYPATHWSTTTHPSSSKAPRHMPPLQDPLKSLRPLPADPQLSTNAPVRLKGKGNHSIQSSGRQPMRVSHNLSQALPVATVKDSVDAGSSMGSCTSRSVGRDTGARDSHMSRKIDRGIRRNDGRGVQSTLASTEKPNVSHRQSNVENDWSPAQLAGQLERSLRRSASVESLASYSSKTDQATDSRRWQHPSTPTPRRHSFKSTDKSSVDVGLPMGSYGSQSGGKSVGVRDSRLSERNDIKFRGRNDSSVMQAILGPLDRGSAEKQNVLPPKKSSVGNEELTRLPAEHSRTSMRKYASTESLVSLKDNDQASHYRPSTPTPRRKHSNRETVSDGYDMSHSRALTNSKRTSSVEDLISKADRISIDHSHIYPKQSTDYTSHNTSRYRGTVGSPSSHQTLGSGTSLQSDSPTSGTLKASYASHSLVRPSKYPGLIGLKNLGNTCFMNSVLQCLSHTQLLTDYFLYHFDMETKRKDSSKKGRLANAYLDLIREMWHAPGQDCDVALSRFKQQIQRFAPRFVGYSQQDSQEFLRFLLDGLHEDLNKATGKPEFEPPVEYRESILLLSDWSWNNYKKCADSKITDLFVGQLKSTVKCKKCSKMSHTFDPFWDLSLPIPQQRTSSYSYLSTYCSPLYSTTSRDRLGLGSSLPSTPSLDDCFKLFTQVETLDGSEKPYCSHCGEKTASTKEIKLDKLPPILVIHLKRFGGLRFRTKVSTSVTFPARKPLDLANFCHDHDISNSKYQLYAVSNHSGSTFGGHYTAHCYHHSNKTWHLFNDTRVNEVSESSVCGSQAYVLFYERCSPVSSR